jgi:CubicO group peptidase (beta-lactamase class C family)
MRFLFQSIVWIFCLALPLTAQSNVSQSNKSEPSQSGRLARLTASDAEGWIGGYMPYALRRNGIPGAVVVVVKDGQIVFSKGYGTSDVATGAPVDPAKTLFRPGSISKLFTFTAVMQLVDQGKIDLDADVNRYLDFEIPPFDGKPVTMRHMMTHSAGFEETAKNIIVSKPGNFLPLDKVVKVWVPERVVAPGQYPAYSNYASTLAGYIVQRVSKTPFEVYIADNILKPLGMNNSSFAQPLPKPLAVQMSKGYFTEDRPKPAFELASMGPAGGLSMTGEDAARFMIAHLNRGTYNGAQMLKPETADLMHRTALQVTTPANGMTLGFMELSQDGNRAIGHGGDTEAFHSMMTLFPDSNVGVYVSLNGEGRDNSSSAVRFELTNMFVSRYLPKPPTVKYSVDKKTAAEHAALLASSGYILSRSSSSNFLAIGTLLGQVGIAVNPDGTISVPIVRNVSGGPMTLREISPFIWQEVGGSNRLVAVVKNGKVVRWAIEPYSAIAVLLPAPMNQSAKILNPLGGTAIAIILLSALAWPIAALVRHRYQQPLPFTGTRVTSYRLTRGAAVLTLIGLIGIGYLITTVGSGLEGIETLSNRSGLIITIQAVLAIGLVGGLIAAVYNLYAVLTQGAGWFGKLWSVLLLAAFGTLLWIAFNFNLINFSTDF